MVEKKSYELGEWFWKVRDKSLDFLLRGLGEL